MSAYTIGGTLVVVNDPPGTDPALKQAVIALATAESSATALAARVATLEDSFRKITLSAAAEAGNAIVVTGAVVEADGTALAVATEVLVRTLAVTADKGDITVTAGTSQKVFSPTTGVNEAWITTTAGGAFAFSVANDAAEDTLVQVSTNLGYSATLKLTFA
jgi:hypothetical protein